MRKKILGKLEKCYSLALLDYKGDSHILVAAEKVNQCRMYSLKGELEEVLWEEPGGVMSIVPIPWREGEFLATNCFYSPNDSSEASIVYVRPGNHGWSVTTLCRLPFVHRFDIMSRDGKNYLIACTLKSGHEYKDDWRSPGKVFAAELPDELTQIDAEHMLNLQVIKKDMLCNHGYFRDMDGNIPSALVACQQGIYRFTPPSANSRDWDVERILDIPASDCAAVDLDGDGEKELVVFSPFHGDTLLVFRKDAGTYKKVYEHPKKLEFLHAICLGTLKGRPAVYAGYRKGNRELIAVTMYNGAVETHIIDRDCGPANVLFYQKQGREYLVSANREIDEIALYTFETEE